MASLEVTKHMRARIRAPFAVLAILLVALALSMPGAAALAQDRVTLPLSLDDAVRRALESNADIAVERYNPELSAQGVLSAEGYYDPYLFANLSRSSTDTKGTNFFSGGDAVNTKTGRVELRPPGIPVQTGADLSLAFNNNKRDTNNAFTTFNPVFNSNLSVSLSQPLLKGFKRRLAAHPAQAGQEEPRDLRRPVSPVDRQHRGRVKGYYYELLFAIDNLAAAQKNLRAREEAAGGERDPREGRDDGSRSTS
jgi:outer membrane protein